MKAGGWVGATWIKGAAATAERAVTALAGRVGSHLATTFDTAATVVGSATAGARKIAATLVLR